ncbi:MULTISPECIES: flagellar basal body-associated FliL family protein [Bacillus]|uniref:Flagellar protein FliL n=2 Tax=Bacillus TaxID=1386 RepID=A0A0M3R998_9BACI|nr:MULTISPECIES: flagellar basal body-associated FliL family protein [Bacillus]ALC81062.1 flagellar basal body-associated protein FliL [Bacillus gobiensis]MBP1080022.1 flagellar FliL protein [Bacillus capparidis]MED1095411.1 flagellar basal body-associated FliL family protein [Bacillus capparidis]
MNKKLVNVSVIVIVAIAALCTAAFLVLKSSLIEDSNKEPTIDEVLEASVDINDVITNLQGDSIVRISLKLETDSKKAKEKDSTIELLANLKADEIEGAKGKVAFKNKLKEKVNAYMREGQITKVYITSFNLQ